MVEKSAKIHTAILQRMRGLAESRIRRFLQFARSQSSESDRSRVLTAVSQFRTHPASRIMNRKHSFLG